MINDYWEKQHNEEFPSLVCQLRKQDPQAAVIFGQIRGDTPLSGAENPNTRWKTSAGGN